MPKSHNSSSHVDFSKSERRIKTNKVTSFQLIIDDLAASGYSIHTFHPYISLLNSGAQDVWAAVQFLIAASGHMFHSSIGLWGNYTCS